MGKNNTRKIRARAVRCWLSLTVAWRGLDLEDALPTDPGSMAVTGRPGGSGPSPSLGFPPMGAKATAP